jgi:putative addiction module killer protein
VNVPPGIVELYISAHDGKLFAEFMAGIAREPIHARILNRLDRARNGLLGDWRAVGEGACELRFDVGPDIACSSDWTAKKVILVCSGTKKTQARDIAAARIYRRDYDT